MNLFVRLAGRRAGVTLLMVLLLALAVAVCAIGYSAWVGASAQREEISGGYTTIAVPLDFDIGAMEYDEAAELAHKLVFGHRAAEDAPQVIGIDRRALLSAHVKDSKSLSSSRIDPGEYNTAFDHECYSLAVFAVRCDSIEDMDTSTSSSTLSASPIWFYEAIFSVEDIIFLSDAYDCFPRPDKIAIMSSVFNPDGTAPFEAGKTYLVFGQYSDYRVIRTDNGYEQLASFNRLLLPFPAIRGLSVSSEFETPALIEAEREGCKYYFPSAGTEMWACEYTGSPWEFIESPAGAHWKNNILPMCRINSESAAVILTDNIASMYSFNTGENSLLSGRFFYANEYVKGDPVCIVSASYAELNNLALGDKITLDFYNSSYSIARGALANSIFATPGKEIYYSRHCMTPDAAIGICKPYTIVGIYTGPRFGFGTYHFNADTIFVPKASVTRGDEYDIPLDCLMNSLILENGSADEFEEYLSSQGYGGLYLYFDQQFDAMAESLDALEANALRLMLIGVGAFLLVCALFLFLSFRRMTPGIRGLRLLGCSSGMVFRELIAALLPLELISAIVGASLAAALFETVTGRLLSATLTLRPDAVFLIAAAAFILTAAASAICASHAARRSLMRAK